LLGGGLLLSCIDQLILSGFLTPLYSKVWNTSFLISEGGFFAPMLSSFAGYRATPSLMDIIIYGAYWIVIYFLLKTKKAKIHAL
jgi:high-affinity Fe2+/Pb2+ permease